MAAENEQGQERTEQATAKRQEQARSQGQVPRSRDLSTMLVLLSAAAALAAYGGHIGVGLREVFVRRLNIGREDIFDPMLLPRFLLDEMLAMSWRILPFLLLTAGVALLAPLLSGGWVFSSQLIAVNWSRLNPVSGLGRLLGVHGLVEMLKSLFKISLLMAVSYLVIRYQLPTLIGLSRTSPQPGMHSALDLLSHALLIFCGVTVLIAGIDVPYQIWSHNRKLKMSRQEIKEELRETDGKPEVKAKIRRMQQEAARRRMMQEVPKADVIVTNPTHFAVALRYDGSRMRAPRVIARGADEVAAKIRAIAIEHRVPLLSAPPLARALYYSAKLNDEIPAGLYVAVAQVLAYVFQLKQERRTDRPLALHDLPIPDDLRREA